MAILSANSTRIRIFFDTVGNIYKIPKNVIFCVAKKIQYLNDVNEVQSRS